MNDFRFEYKPKHPLYEQRKKISKELEMWTFGAVLLALLLWLKPNLSFTSIGSLATLMLAIKAQRELRILKKGLSEIQISDDYVKFSYFHLYKDPIKLPVSEIKLERKKDHIEFRKLGSKEILGKAFKFSMVAGDWEQLIVSFSPVQNTSK